ncbi:MAG: hypothetical protein PVS3B3_26010 [Ktedonobacteraceae bacterium]
MKAITVSLHDRSTIEAKMYGSGPAILLSVNPTPIQGPQADEMRKWGTDPALGKSLIDDLSDTFTVVAFDYEGHVMAHPMADTLTPENIARDFLAVADAAGADTFAYYGYSWLGLSGLQLAIRTDRLWALAIGGFPPIAGPYKEMLKVTLATHEMAKQPKAKTTTQASDEEFDWSSVEITMSEGQTKQFVTLYEALQHFDDRKVQDMISCPRLCFAGSADKIDYSERWGNAEVRIVEPLITKRDELERLGWKVHVFDSLDHIQAMQAATVLPILRPWLIAIAKNVE